MATYPIRRIVFFEHHYHAGGALLIHFLRNLTLIYAIFFSVTDLNAEGSETAFYSCQSKGNGSAEVSLQLRRDNTFQLKLLISGDQEPLIYKGTWSSKETKSYLAFDPSTDVQQLERVIRKTTRPGDISLLEPRLAVFAPAKKKITIWGVYCFKQA